MPGAINPYFGEDQAKCILKKGYSPEKCVTFGLDSSASLFRGVRYVWTKKVEILRKKAALSFTTQPGVVVEICVNCLYYGTWSYDTPAKQPWNLPKCVMEGWPKWIGWGDDRWCPALHSTCYNLYVWYCLYYRSSMQFKKAACPVKWETKLH